MKCVGFPCRIIYTVFGKPPVSLLKLFDYIANDRAEHYAIMRPQFLNAQQKQQIAQSIQQKVGQPFVLREKNQTHLYCTTLIADEIQRVYPDFQPQWQYKDTPIFKGNYLFPNAFFSYPQTQMVYSSWQN